MASKQSYTATVVQELCHLTSLLTDRSQIAELDGNRLSLADLVYISRYEGHAATTQAVLEGMEKSRQSLHGSVGKGEVIYGVNTGFGASADVRQFDTLRLQRILVRELTYGLLPAGKKDFKPERTSGGYDASVEDVLESQTFPWSWSRAAIVIRINSLLKCASAIRPVIVERMIDLLQHDITPMIPIRGSISASGDLSPLSYIASVLQGKPTARIVRKSGEHGYADEALKLAKIEPIVLQAKEGLAIVNGTAASAAAGALALFDAQGLSLLAQFLTAMTVEALHGSPESFHPFFAETRPHPGQIECASNILRLLDGSKLTQENDGADSVLRQDRYSIRTAAQWMGPSFEDLLLAHQQMTIELNSATDNPLVTQEGKSIHGGNFQAKAVTSAMEKTRQAIQTIGRMTYIQCSEMINPATSMGLPTNLVLEDPSTSGVFKAIDIQIAALYAEIGFLANPVNHVQNAEMGNQSLNSLALISARYTHTAVRVLSELMAAHLLALCQALDFRAMHSQFMASFRPQFSTLLSAKCNSSAYNACRASLEDALWVQLQRSFDATSLLDYNARFPAIGKSLRSTFLDNTDFTKQDGSLAAMEDFVSAFQELFHEAWVAHRDAYFLQGDATKFLGRGSKTLYNFVRRDLEIPIVRTSCIQTPPEYVDGSAQQPGRTLGSFTAAIYRSIRDGSLFSILCKDLQ